MAIKKSLVAECYQPTMRRNARKQLAPEQASSKAPQLEPSKRCRSQIALADDESEPPKRATTSLIGTVLQMPEGAFVVSPDCEDCAKLVEQLKSHVARVHVPGCAGTQGSAGEALMSAAAASAISLAVDDDRCVICGGAGNESALVSCDGVSCDGVSCPAWFHPVCAGYKKPLLEDPTYNGHEIALQAYCAGCLNDYKLTTEDIIAEQEEFLAIKRCVEANADRYEWCPVAQDGHCSLGSVWDRLPLNLKQDSKFETFVSNVASNAVACVEHSQEEKKTKAKYIGLFKTVANEPHLLADLWSMLEVSYLYDALTKHVFPSVCLTLYKLSVDKKDLQPMVTFGNGQDQICLLQWNCRVAAHFDVLVIHWTFVASSNGALFDNKRRFTKVRGDGWDCATRGSVGWASGVHEWAIRIDEFADSVSIGISQADINKTDAAANTAIRYDVFSGSGKAVDTKDKEHQCFGHKLAKGSVVLLRLDMDAKSLTFGLNCKWTEKPTFKGIASGTWFPYVAFCRQGCTVSIVPLGK